MVYVIKINYTFSDIVQFLIINQEILPKISPNTHVLHILYTNFH